MFGWFQMSILFTEEYDFRFSCGVTKALFECSSQIRRLLMPCVHTMCVWLSSNRCDNIPKFWNSIEHKKVQIFRYFSVLVTTQHLPHSLQTSLTISSHILSLILYTPTLTSIKAHVQLHTHMRKVQQPELK